LLVMRSDYKMTIDDLHLPPLRHGENWQEVGRFTIAAGTKFVARSGLALQPDALDRLVTSASELDDSPGLIRPITLNVVGHVLSQGRATAPSLDAGRLVRHYIEQSVEQPAIREFAPRVLKELVTEQGTKRPRSEKDLLDQTRLSTGEVRAVMNGLLGAALARPLDAAQGVWELSHDFVARAVTRYLGRRRVDWPALIRGFAAPALFCVLAATVVGAIAWRATQRAEARANQALAESINNDLGVEPDKPLTARQRQALWKLALADQPVKSDFVSIIAGSREETIRSAPEFAQISRALGQLRPTPIEAEILIGAVVAGLQTTEGQRNVPSLVAEFKSLAAKLTEAQAQQALAPFLEQIGQTSDPNALQVLAQAL